MLRHLLIGQRVVAVEFINVEYLPNWRPNRDYRSTTSAQRQLGGGVLRDLSHELDFMHYLFGAPSKAVAVVDNHQILEIDTEDSVHAIVHVDPDITATLHLSYLNRVRRRTIDVTTSEMSIHCDLLSGKVLVNGDPTQLQVDRDTTFERMHEAVYAGDMDIACTFQQGVEVLRTIDMIETSNALGAWVMR
jgi:predicted dehydrogenase